jgi:ubiquitin-conjugating enzyme (huntingtin interacting protein 2)
LQLAKLVEMGFSEDTANSALESCGGDENAALEKLCSG